MKQPRVILAATLAILALVIFLVRTRTPPREEITNYKSQITNSEPQNVRTPEPQNSITPSASLVTPITSDPLIPAVREDVVRLRAQIGDFLLLVKDPYRPPLGDNADITLALTGHNRRNVAAIQTNDPSIVNGQLVDRWGTPYWFHPRAPDAIDVLSAGPDRELFTPDDIASDHFQTLEKR